MPIPTLAHPDSPVSMRPLVVVIENPQENPTVHVVGDVEVIETSSYPATSWCPGEERVGDEDFPFQMLALADRFPADHPARKDLRGLAAEWRRRHADDEIDHPIEEVPAHG